MISYQEAVIKQKKHKSEYYFPSGIQEFDGKFKGFPIGVNLLAGRPGMGLTTFCLHVVTNPLAEEGSLYISLDNISSQIISRKTLDGNLNNFLLEDRVYTASRIISLIDDSVNKNSIVIIDNFQLIEFDCPSEFLLKELNKVAARKKLCIILQYSLNRRVEKRGGDKVPRIKDLNDNPEVKYLCASLFYLYRYGYYGIFEDEYGTNTANTARIGMLDGREEDYVQFRWLMTYSDNED